jgi:hypothetical protein
VRPRHVRSEWIKGTCQYLKLQPRERTWPGEFTGDFRIARDSDRTRMRAILFASEVEVLLVSYSVLGSIPIPVVRCRLWPVFSRR